MKRLAEKVQRWLTATLTATDSDSSWSAKAVNAVLRSVQ